jgi:hypothetical protein
MSMTLRIHERIANANTMKRVINWAVPNGASEKTKTSFDKLQKHWPNAFMLLTVGAGQTYMIYKSDDMPKKRRIPLIINNVITCSLSILGAIIIDKRTEKLKDKFIERAGVLFKDEQKAIIQNGIKVTIPLLVSSLLYKYIGPVLATPITDKVNKYMVKHGMIDYSKD